MAVVILAVVGGAALVAAVVLGVRWRSTAARLGTATARAGELEGDLAEARAREADLDGRAAELSARVAELVPRVAGLEGEVAELEARVAELDEARARSEEAAATAEQATEAAEERLREVQADLQLRQADLRRRQAELDDARAAAAEAEAAATAAVEQAEAAHRELVEARAETEAQRRAAGVVAAAQPAPDAVRALWALERARTERTWRHSVAVGPAGAGPFADADDPVRVAVEVEAAALREDVGAELGTDWRVPAGLPPTAALLVVRAAQELLTAASRTLDEAVLHGDLDGTDVALRLCRPDGSALPLADVLDGLATDTVAGIEVGPDELRVALGGD